MESKTILAHRRRVVLLQIVRVLRLLLLLIENLLKLALKLIVRGNSSRVAFAVRAVQEIEFE